MILLWPSQVKLFGLGSSKILLQDPNQYRSGGEGFMHETNPEVGQCLLCGSSVHLESGFLDAGEGFLHAYCLAQEKIAR